MFEFERSEEAYTVKMRLKTWGAMVVVCLALYGVAQLVAKLWEVIHA